MQIYAVQSSGPHQTVYLDIYVKLYSPVESTGLCTQAFLCEFMFPRPVESTGLHWTLSEKKSSSLD